MDNLDNFFADIRSAMKQVQFSEFINSEEHEMILDMYYEFKTVTEVITALARKRSK